MSSLSHLSTYGTLGYSRRSVRVDHTINLNNPYIARIYTFHFQYTQWSKFNHYHYRKSKKIHAKKKKEIHGFRIF